MQRFTDLSVFQQTPQRTPWSRCPQMMLKHGMFMYRECGNLQALRRDEAIAKIGLPVVQSMEAVAGTWLDLDNDPRAENAVPEMLDFPNADVSRPSTADMMQIAALLPVALVVNAMNRRAVR